MCGTSENILLCVLIIYVLFCILYFNNNVGDKREVQDQDRFLFCWVLLCLFKMLDPQQRSCDHGAISWAQSKISRAERRKDPGFLVVMLRHWRGEFRSLSLNLGGPLWWLWRVGAQESEMTSTWLSFGTCSRHLVMNCSVKCLAFLRLPCWKEHIKMKEDTWEMPAVCLLSTGTRHIHAGGVFTTWHEPPTPPSATSETPWAQNTQQSHSRIHDSQKLWDSKGLSLL